MDTNGHLCWGCYSTAQCVIHNTTALHVRRSACADDLQHGIGLQHGAHGSVRIPGSDSTARRNSQATALHARRSAHTGELQHGAMHHSAPATYRPQHGTHGAVRTPGSYSTAPCAATPPGCKVLAQTRALQIIAGHRATRAPPKHLKDKDTPHAHWHGHGALSAGQWA
jgi:hypothetical protein